MIIFNAFKLIILVMLKVACWLVIPFLIVTVISVIWNLIKGYITDKVNSRKR